MRENTVRFPRWCPIHSTVECPLSSWHWSWTSVATQVHDLHTKTPVKKGCAVRLPSMSYLQQKRLLDFVLWLILRLHDQISERILYQSCSKTLTGPIRTDNFIFLIGCLEEEPNCQHVHSFFSRSIWSHKQIRFILTWLTKKANTHFPRGHSITPDWVVHATGVSS